MPPSPQAGLPGIRTIATEADLAAELDALLRLDPRLTMLAAAREPLPLRLVEPGFASLCGIIVSQQVSTASAAAIFGRLSALLNPLTPDTVRTAAPELFRQAGLSAAKVRTLLAVADADLDLPRIATLPAAEAVALMTAVPGIGPWTAESFLLFACGHPDVLPAGDVALQAAAADALGLAARPSARALAETALGWSPHRSTAARLLWSHYRTLRRGSGMPVGTA